MPTTSRGDRTIGYETAGDGPAVAFVPTLGYGPWQWSWQVPAIAGPFEAIAIEPWGTGGSEAPAAGSGSDTVAALVHDVEAVLADADARRVHLLGVGLGGHVALEHARRYDRARSLALIATTPGLPDAEPPSSIVETLYASRDDPDAVRDSLAAALSPAFRAEQPAVLDGIVEWRTAEDAARQSWAALAPAFSSWERPWPLHEVTLPALVVHGGADAVVPPENGERLADLLPRGERECFPEAGHLVTIERSRPVNDRLVGFLEAQTADR